MASLGDLFISVGAKIDGFKTAMTDVSKALDKTAANAASAGFAMSAAFTAPLIGIAAAALKAGMEVDSAMDRIRTGTGATGATLNGLRDSFKTVFTSVPASAEVASTAITDLNARLGLTGKPLEELSVQLVNLARLNKAEVGPLIAATTRLFGDWSVSTDKQSQTLDYLFRTSQSTGIGITRLSELVVQFGAPLRAMGFSLEQGAALMGKWEKEGVNLETVLSGMRFALGKFAAAGEEPRVAFAKVQAAIAGAKTETEATAIAFDTFGKRAAADMGRAIMEGRFKIDDLVKSLQNSKETINKAAADTDDFGEKWVKLKNKLTLALEPLGGQLMTTLDNLLTHGEPVVKMLEAMIKGFGDLPPAIQAAVGGATVFLAILGPTSMALSGVVSAVKVLAPLLGTALAGAASLATPALIAMGAAIAGWSVYAGIRYILDFNKHLGETYDAAGKGKGAITGLGDAWDKSAGQALSAQIATDLHTAATAKHGAAVELTAAQIKKATDALSKAESVLGVSKINTTEATAAYNLLFGAWNAGKISVLELQKAYDALQQRLVAAGKVAASEVTPAWVALGQAQEHAVQASKNMLTAIADWINAGEPWGKKIKLAAIAHDDLGFSMAGSKLEAADLAEALMVLSGKYPKVEQAAVDMNKAIKGGIIETAAIMRSVGVKSQEEYRAEVTKLERALEDIQAQQLKGKATTMDVARVEMALLRARIEAHDELTDAEKKHYQQLKIMLDPVKALDSAYRTMLTSIKSAFKQLEDDVARGIARSIVEGQNLGDAFKTILKNIAEDIITILIKGALAELVKAITGVSGGLAGIFGGGASAAGGATAAAGGVASAAGGVASSAGGIASSAAGAGGQAAGMGVSAIAGLVTGAVSAVSGVISNFQNMAMNKSLDLIEHETRFSQLHLLHLLENSNQWWPKLNHLVDIWGAIGDLPERLQGQFSGGFAGVTAAGGGGVTFQINGGYFLSSRALDEFMEEVIRRLKQRNA